MVQVNMLAAKTGLSKYVKMVENGEEDYILIARDGKAVAKIVPLESTRHSRIGIAKGETLYAGDIDFCNDEIAEEFGL